MSDADYFDRDYKPTPISVAEAANLWSLISIATTTTGLNQRTATTQLRARLTAHCPEWNPQ